MSATRLPSVDFLRRFRSLLALALMVAVLSVVSDKFLSSENAWNILRQISVNLCLSTGMTLVILSGGIDLSVGAVLAFGGAVAAGVLRDGLSPCRGPASGSRPRSPGRSSRGSA